MKPRAEDVARARAFAERTLTREEFDAYVNAPITAHERDNALELHRWFVRRYPTARDRLAYVRRAYRRWTRNR